MQLNQFQVQQMMREQAAGGASREDLRRGWSHPRGGIHPNNAVDMIMAYYGGGRVGPGLRRQPVGNIGRGGVSRRPPSNAGTSQASQAGREDINTRLARQRGETPEQIEKQLQREHERNQLLLEKLADRAIQGDRLAASQMERLRGIQADLVKQANEIGFRSVEGAADRNVRLAMQERDLGFRGQESELAHQRGLQENEQRAVINDWLGGQSDDRRAQMAREIEKLQQLGALDRLQAGAFVQDWQNEQQHGRGLEDMQRQAELGDWQNERQHGRGMIQSEHQAGINDWLGERADMRRGDLAFESDMRQSDLSYGLQDRQQAGAIERMRVEDDIYRNRDEYQQLLSDVNMREADAVKTQRALSPEGQRLWGDLSGELREIKGHRGSLRGEQYLALLNQWIQKFDDSGLQNHVVLPPTATQQWEENIVTDPQTGRRFQRIIRSGQPSFKEIDEADQPGTTLGKSVHEMTPMEYFADDERRKRAFDEALKMLKQEQPVGDDRPISIQQVQARMVEMFQAERNFLTQIEQIDGRPRQQQPFANTADPAMAGSGDVWSAAGNPGPGPQQMPPQQPMGRLSDDAARMSRPEPAMQPGQPSVNQPSDPFANQNPIQELLSRPPETWAPEDKQAIRVNLEQVLGEIMSQYGAYEAMPEQSRMIYDMYKDFYLKSLQ